MNQTELRLFFLRRTGLSERLAIKVPSVVDGLIEDVVSKKYPRAALARLPFFVNLGIELKHAAHVAKGSLALDDDQYDISFVNQVEVEGGTPLAAERILDRMIRDGIKCRRLLVS